MTRPTIISVSSRLATPEDAHIEAYDNTKLQAVNTCPTWGVLRYAMHKTFSTNSRAMALEAGSAMHEVFAAVRLWQLWKYDLKQPNEITIEESVLYPRTVVKGHLLVDSLVMHHGYRLFGEERFEDMLAQIKEEEDDRTNCLNFCLQSLYSSGFYDDPYDKRRTMSNLEECAIMYIDKWDFHRNPIWIRDRDDPNSDVGIEIAFDIVLTFKLSDPDSGIIYERQFRFCGKLDGLHTRDWSLRVSENKTAARLDDAWRMSFEMSSQITGYALAGTVFTGEPIEKAIVYGLQVPLPKSYDIGGMCIEYVSRPSHMFERWFDWFLHSVLTYEEYANNPTAAPKYTHSCNRYYRPCSFIPFCTGDDEEQQLALAEMVTEEWSPLHTENSGD